MSRPPRRTVTLLALALAGGAAVLAASDERSAGQPMPVAVDGVGAGTHALARGVASRTVRVHGRRGYAHLLKQPPRQAADEDQERDSEVNPDSPVLPGPEPAGPQTPPTLDPASGPVDAAAARTPSPRAFANDYALFRSSALAPGSTVTRQTGEPTVANDRNAVLFTGNKFAAVSADNGLSWQYLDPKSADYQQPDGGFCCDQIAYAVDRGAYSLVLWLKQYANDGALNPTDGANGRLELIVYQGRKELLEDQQQSDFCEIEFKPSSFGFPTNTYFDFNQISNTKKYLYISSKAEKNLGVDNNGDGQLDSKFLGGVVWRVALDDLDSDSCSPTATYWSGVGTGFNSALVQGAGASDTMYWAFHGAATDELTVTRVKDGSKTGDVFTVTTSAYKATARGSAHCPLPDATDPCLRVNDPINTGYLAGTEIGWLWNVGEGTGFPFPHIRVARLTTNAAHPDDGPLLIDEPDIWNPDHAWVYAAIGINGADHVGITAYEMGGGLYPKAAATLIDDVTPDTDWASLFFHGIVTSDAGTAGNTWGDYQAVRPYGDCPNTFAAAVMSMQGGSANQNAQPRFAWFGRERDGCPDLAVTALTFAPSDVSAGQQLLIAHTTRNSGSGTADASTTRFYLSRDAWQSTSDIRLDTTSSVPALARGISSGELVATTVPALATGGTFYVIACADDTEKIDEISDTNNCLTAPETLVIDRVKPTATATDVDFGSLIHARPGGRVTASVRLYLPKGSAKRPTATLYFSPRSAASGRMLRIGSARPSASARVDAHHRLRLRVALHLPKTVTGGRRQFLVVCIGRPRADRCALSRRPFFVS